MSNTITIQELIQIRKNRKAHKPTFIRRETHNRKRLAAVWRHPRGMHNKQKKHLAGKHKMPEQGWGSDARIRGMHPKGVNPITISTIKELQTLKQNEGAVIARTTGNKRRKELLQYAIKNNMIILNVKNPKELLEKLQTKNKKNETKKDTANKTQDAQNQKTEISKSKEIEK